MRSRGLAGVPSDVVACSLGSPTDFGVHALRRAGDDASFDRAETANSCCTCQY